ncbi:phage distal tail protein [Micromonospora carbonacea]|uniref:Phage tail protein n=1 Tax=Micromonospora carbonacea TaxID=47853 RepID=A0A1C5AC52_9ACTN|nr:phage tail domain-containing protein [Micromonospora carbonacea]SCF42666.1 Phage tail protein [Micromonospora carbonacea]
MPLPRFDPGEYVPLWIDPAGVEWYLNPPGRDLFSLNAVTGYGLTPIAIQSRPAARGGVQVTGVRRQARNLTWPVRIRGKTHLEFLQRWRDLAESFALTMWDGPGLFRLVRPDGTAREVLAYYQSGWEGEPGQGQTEDTPTLSLFCPDGLWRDSQPITLSRAYGETVDYLDPFPNISSGDVLGATEMTNPGTVEAWPTWTLTGPATQLVATNNTLGQQFTINYALSAGQTITITTDPGRVLGPSGEMLGGALQRPGSTLWRLRPGVNDLEFTVAGSGPGTTITVTFYPHYNTA